jgi:hypothetical protein
LEDLQKPMSIWSVKGRGGINGKRRATAKPQWQKEKVTVHVYWFIYLVTVVTRGCGNNNWTKRLLSLLPLGQEYLRMCCSHKSLISIWYTINMHFISICMHSCMRILNPDLFPSIEHNPIMSKLDRSGKHKIKSTSKSCRRFLYTILAVLPKVRLNLALLGKKLIILRSIIR